MKKKAHKNEESTKANKKLNHEFYQGNEHHEDVDLYNMGDSAPNVIDKKE